MGSGMDTLPRAPAIRRPPRSRRLLARNLALVAVVVVATGAVAFAVGAAAAKPTAPGAFGAPGLSARSAAADFAPLNRSGLAPSDVLMALPVPVHATVVQRANQAGAGTFDAAVTYTSPAGPAAIRQFFPAALARRQWRVSRQAGVILATHPSSDGFYWEAGVTVLTAAQSRTAGSGTAGSGTAGSRTAGDGPGGGSRFTIRLLQYNNGS